MDAQGWSCSLRLIPPAQGCASPPTTGDKKMKVNDLIKLISTGGKRIEIAVRDSERMFLGTVPVQKIKILALLRRQKKIFGKELDISIVMATTYAESDTIIIK
jgi:hypothetical protein